MAVTLDAHDLRGEPARFAAALRPDDYAPPQALGRALRAAGSDGIAYPSVRHEGGGCVALFHPDLAADPIQGRHLDYHWDGARVDYVREAGRGVWRIGER